MKITFYKNYFLNFLLIVFIMIFLNFTDKTKVRKMKNLDNNIVEIVIDSISLKDNALNGDTKQTLYVLLPPSYNNSKKRYPVVYYLHGFSGSSYEILRFQRTISDAMKSDVKEFIIVGVNGATNIGGSFFVNSPIIGNWEDFTVKEVVSVIDKKFKTLSDVSSRGIAGFSMGGFGSINLALKYPEIYSTTYSLCPGLFDENGLINAMPTWDSSFLNAYGAAFSPNLNIPYPFAEIPKFDNTDRDNKIKDRWYMGFGNLKGKIKNYINKKNLSLNAIFINYSLIDRYQWITEGSVYFSELLNEKNIKHELEEIPTGHAITDQIVKDSMLPFFSKNLKFE